ncbi:MAG TPA: hypothetical protein VKM69_06245 [Natronoarchaeum rubrum]|nr:hypothetical protein [Natronoarchaeum rubrum]
MEQLPYVRVAVLLIGPLALFVPTYFATRADLGEQDAKALAGGLAASLGIAPAIGWDATPWFRPLVVGVYLAMLALSVAVLVGTRTRFSLR